ncbi:MAG: citrate (Si)-synthase [Acidobacteriota bacterium]
MPDLKTVLSTKIQPWREEVKNLNEKHGDMKISDVTVGQAFGGMRSVKCMTWEPSALDPMEGIRYRGLSIPEVRERLPKTAGGDEPLPEGLFYLLLTGDIPERVHVDGVTAEWRRREGLPEYAKRTLDALPLDVHPMTQFAIGILALQRQSKFSDAVHHVNKLEHWDSMFEDAMTLLAQLPHVAAYIYRRCYRGNQHIPPGPLHLDWSGNFAHMLGYEDPEFAELMRLYLVLHADHEGGNVSAHTVRLVGSALSDPFLSLSAGMCGLAGPLHGLANQDSLAWIIEMREAMGDGVPSRAAVETYVNDWLASGRVVPGYGHAVLRQTDPRYTAQQVFCRRHFPEDELFQVVSMLYDVVPATLQKQGKAKNPWPNVDAISGTLLTHYGMTETNFYTVLFGVSRAMGTLASLIIDRILLLPLERPKSVTTEWVKMQVSAVPKV